MSGLCEEMKSRGVNLDWYDKRKHRPTATGPVPLDDAICTRNSIFKQDGSLWTVKSDGEAYSKVRELDRVVARDVYVCLSCKAPINVRRSTITRGDRLETLFLLPFPSPSTKVGSWWIIQILLERHSPRRSGRRSLPTPNRSPVLAARTALAICRPCAMPATRVTK